MKFSARVGNFDGDIGDLVKKYSSNFMEFPIGRGDVRKLALQRRESSGSYLLMVSSSPYKDEDHNMILTIHGPLQDVVDEMMDDFLKVIGVPTRDPHPELQKTYERMAQLFGSVLDR